MNPIDENLRSVSIKIPKIYSTEQLFYDLREEIQKYSEFIIRFFPEKIEHYSNNMLSRFWKGNKDYINNVVNHNRDISEDDLQLLEDNLNKEYKGEKLENCFKLIQKFRDGFMSRFEFIDVLRRNLAILSIDVKISWMELGILLGKNRRYVHGIITQNLNPNDTRYRPNFKLSLETLEEIKDFLVANLREDAVNCIELIDKYERTNPDLKEYSYQFYTINDGHYFSIFKFLGVSDMDEFLSRVDVLNRELLDKTIKKFYWFAFICGDGYVSKGSDYIIKIKLHNSDKGVLELFSDEIGLDKDRIKTYPQYNEKHKIRWYSQVQFKCKIMVEDLKGLGVFGSKEDIKRLPIIVRLLIDHAKEISLQTDCQWEDTNAGKIAMGWLNGFYDAEGNTQGSSARISQGGLDHTGKNLLEEIKYYYGIENSVNSIEPNNPNCTNYYLYLGKIFKRMLDFEYGMTRKRKKN